MPGELALDLRGVAKLYGRTAALRALSLSLREGETMAVLGPNGSGKTTLLKIIAGAVGPTLGGGTVLGRDLRTERYLLRGKVGLLASESHLYDDLTGEENLQFVMTMAGIAPTRDHVAAALAQVGLANNARERVRSFSSGMQRRLSLARLLVLDPELLLLDEPYNSLDAGAMAVVDGLVRRWSSQRRTTVLATHDAERALALADVVAVLQAGALVFYGSPASYRMRHAQYVG